jgi:CIC family chloride channel protein
VPTQRDSPVHRDALLLNVLKAVRVDEVMVPDRPYVSFKTATPLAEILRLLSESTWQDVFPVEDGAGKMTGLVTSDVLRLLANEGKDASWVVAADIMQPPVTVCVDDDVRLATERLIANGLREIPVVDTNSRIVGFLDEHEVAKVYLRADARGEAGTMSGTMPIPPAPHRRPDRS